MRRVGPIAVFTVVAIAAVLMVPAAAFGVLTNEYGMKYTGQATCISCHEVSYRETTHGEFAKVGADPVGDFMWPAGRQGVGETVGKDQIAFTLGGGTGLREYLALNEAGGSSTPVNFINVQGDNRYLTAVEASKKAFTSAGAVVIATGENFPDALGGAALAGAVNGPILLTQKAVVPKAVLDEITRLGASTIYVLGSESAVSAGAASQLAAKGTVVRIQGSGRYLTANEVAKKVIELLGAGFGGKAFVATGVNYPDAIAAAPIAFKKGMPIILADPVSGAYTLPAGVTSVQILGSTGAVPAGVETAMKADLGDANVARIGGSNRWATAKLIAEYGVARGMKWDNVGIATSGGFADALSGGPLLGAKNAVMLLTPTTVLDPIVATALSANKAGIFNLHYLGGVPALSMSVRDDVRALLPAHVTGGDPNPFVVPALEWDPIAPDTWEIGSAGIEFETYTCNPCHHLGGVSQGKKPTVGNFVSTSVTGTANTWVTDAAGTQTSPEKYVEGSSIQCEVCHGTGQAGSGVANHFNKFTDYVKILRGTDLLNSQVCGQCHGSYKSKSLYGYTPDQNLNLFVTYRGFGDVPTETSFTANPSAYKFFPNGQNKGDKHSYYTEWTLSGHSYRGQLSSTSPTAQMYQKAGNGHYNAKTSSLDCAKCHTGEGYAKRKNLKIVKDFVPSNTNTGFFGQECASCHLPHNAGTENGMAVRQPDSATTIAGIKMTSICEDCHNWQLEMTAGSVPTTFTTPKVDLTARGGYSHPTREIYNGRGMFEIPAADKFMPGVRCEQCHMPATKSDFPDKTGVERYATQSWKRYSHRMFIMEPGKAKTWGLAAWGDSCSPCHTGQTQDQLQGFIEKWQDDAAEAATEASAAYASAFAGAPGSAEDTNTAAFKALMGRANYNYRNYLGEGSLGAHNPDYIVAGLNKAEQLAKSVNGDFAYVATGGAFPGADYVAGTVVNGDGSGAASARIVITVTGTPYTVTTDGNGNFSFLYASGGASLDSIVWKRSSDPVSDISYPLP